jgi:DNA-binding FadR family transcriptional regulator
MTHTPVDATISRADGSPRRIMSRRSSLRVEVADAIRQKILGGPLPAGTWIATKGALGIEYEVSRTVIREAIARLRSEGLLDPAKESASSSRMPASCHVEGKPPRCDCESISRSISTSGRCASAKTHY